MSNSTAKELYDKWHGELSEQGKDNSNAPWHQMTKMTWLDQPRFLMKWIAAHSLTVATKI